MRDARKLGELEEANKIMEEHRGKIRYRAFVNRVSRMAGDLRKRMGITKLNRNLSPDDKRVIIDRYQEKLNQLMEMAVEKTDDEFK